MRTFNSLARRPNSMSSIGRKTKDISENEYEGITCLACSRLHFINRKTGELLSKSGHWTPVPLVPILRG